MKLALLILYFGVMVGIGLYCRKHTSGINGFVLGGRSVGPWLTAFAYGTSYFSAVVFVGYAGQFGWKYGIAATWAGIGNAILGSLLAWAVLGRRTRILTQHYNSATMPQFFGQRFQSKSLKIGASVIVFVFLIPYTASLFNGLSRLFGMAFHMDYTVCIILMGVLTGIYVIAGGYMATAINDFIQGCVMLVGICVVIAAVLNTQGGFLEALHGLAAVSDPETVNGEVPGIFASFFGPDPVNLLGVVILTSLGTWGLPQMVQKFYAIKSEDSIHKGTIISTLFAVVVAGGCYFLGGFGRLFADQVDVASEGYDAIIPAMLSGLPDLADCGGGDSGSLCLYVHLVLSGDCLFLHLDHRPAQRQHCQKDERLPGCVHHALFHRGFCPDFHGPGHCSVQKFLQLHRPVDGSLLGGAGRFSWPPSSMVCTGKKPPKRLAGPLSSLVRGL